MPTSVQYPVERLRDVERKWKRLLERTVAPKDYATEYRKRLSSAATADPNKPTIQPAIAASTA